MTKAIQPAKCGRAFCVVSAMSPNHMQEDMRTNIHMRVYMSVMPTSTAMAIVMSEAETEYSMSLHTGPSRSMSSLFRHTAAWSTAARRTKANMAHLTLKLPVAMSFLRPPALYYMALWLTRSILNIYQVILS